MLAAFFPLSREWLVTNHGIHKAPILTVPGCSMILPGTIPEIPISCEWSWHLEWSLGVIPAGRTLVGGFVNCAVAK